MLRYHYYDRINLKEIREHPWVCGDVATPDEIEREMRSLKKQFIIKEVQRHSSYFLESTRHEKQPTSLTEYAKYCY